MHTTGLDPKNSPSVSILTYTDLMQRFSAGAILPPSEIDRGLRDCMLAAKRCFGYLVNVRQVRKNRVGNFWLDTFNFRRETHSVGWSFNALIVFVDEMVVLTLVGGQPSITEIEVTRNPLGPLQSLGEALRPSF